jgi:hypothetical protein
MTKPYLSIVIVTRNDNYGGGLLGKLQTFQRVLVELCTEARLQTEIVIVEWNPPPDKPGMADVVRSSLVGSPYVEMRVLTVPASVHAGLPYGSRRPVLEYWGKNVGIRRAAGEFILTTNPDTVFSSQLVDQLKSGRLREDTLYRVDRADVVSPVPQNIPAREIEAWCRHNILRTHVRWIGNGLLHVPANLRLALGAMWRYRMWTPLHLGAAGDFILMHRGQWHKMGGFPEFEMFADRSHHIDTLAVINARYHGLRQHVFGNSCVIYHQEHDRPEQEKPWAASIRFTYDAMRALRRPWTNSIEWGLGDHALPDQIVRDLAPAGAGAAEAVHAN